MIKKIFLLLIILLLTGCYDQKELNTIAIMTATEIVFPIGGLLFLLFCVIYT